MLLIENIKEKQIKKFLNQDFDPKLISDFSNYFEVEHFNLTDTLNLLSPSLSKYLKFYLDKEDIVKNNKSINFFSRLVSDFRYDFYDKTDEDWCEEIRQRYNLPDFHLEYIVYLNNENLNNEMIKFDNKEKLTRLSVKHFEKIKVETIGEFIKIFQLFRNIASKIKEERVSDEPIKEGLLALMLKDLPYDNGFNENQNKVFLEFEKIYSVKRGKSEGINTSHYLKFLEREARKALYKNDQNSNKKQSEFSESQVNLILNKGVERIYEGLNSLLKMLFYVKHLKIIEYKKFFQQNDFEYYFNEDKYQARLKESHKAPHFKKVAIIETLLGSIEAYLKEAEQIIKEVKNAK